MKKYCFLILALLFGSVNILSAQVENTKSLFIVSPGFASFNNGDQGGMSFSNEYIRNVNNRLTYGAKFYFAHGEGNVEGLKPKHDIHISTTALDLNGYYKPFSNNTHFLLIGLGISIDFTRTSYLSNTDFIEKDDKIYTIADTDGIISLLEPVISLHYYYHTKRNMFWGINLNARDLKLYQYIVGIGGGIKF